MKKGNFVFAQGNQTNKITFNPSNLNRPEIQKLQAIQEQKTKQQNLPSNQKKEIQYDNDLGFLKIEKSPLEIKKIKIEETER